MNEAVVQANQIIIDKYDGETGCGDEDDDDDDDADDDDDDDDDNDDDDDDNDDDDDDVNDDYVDDDGDDMAMAMPNMTMMKMNKENVEVNYLVKPQS